MSNYEETSDNLINELALLRQRVVDLEKQLENKSYPQSDTIAIAPQLSQQETLAQHCFDATETLMVAISVDERVTLINRKACEVLGFSHDELIGQNWFDYCIADDEREALRAYFHQLIRGEVENIAKFENPIHINSGEVRIFEWYNNVLRDYDNNVIGTFSTGQDITSRKEMEAKLQASEKRYRNVVQHQTEIICHYNLDLEIIFVNKAYSEILGKPVDEIVGLNLLSTVSPNDVNYVKEKIKQLSPTNTLVTSEIQSFSQDDKIRWFQWQDQAILNEQNEIVEYQAVGRDITERKQAEDALLEEHIVLQTLIDAIPDYIFVKDREGRFLISNKAHTDASGVVSVDDLIGKTAKDVFPDALATQFHDDDDDVMSLQQSRISMERRTVDSDGNDKWVSTTKVPLLDENGDVKGLVGISRDITERKQAEDQIRENEEKFKVLFQMLPVGVFVLNKAREIIEINPALEEMLDMTLADVGSDAYLSRRYIHGDGSPMDRSQFASSRALDEQRAILDVEIGIVKEDNTVIWTSVNAAPIDVEDWSAVVATTDITRRKEAEIAFQNSETRYGRLIEESPFCIHEIGLDKRFISMNPSGLAMINADSEEDIIGMPCLDVVATKDRERIDALMDEAIQGKDIFVEFETAGDSPRIFSSNFIPITDENGIVQKLMGITQDITERKQAEIALYESEAKYRDLVETSQGLIWRVDLEGRFTYLNPIYEELTGYRLDEMLGRNFFEFQGAEVLTGDIESFQAILQGQPILGFETILKTKSGDQIDLIANAKPLFDIDGNVMGIQGTAYDITERKQAENALQESEAKYRDLVETSQGLIWRIDTEGRFTYVNRAWEEILGYSLDELIGNTRLKIIPPEILEHSTNVFNSILAGNVVMGVETVRIKKSGEYVNLFVNTKPLYDADGNVIGTQGTAYDITERKQAEIALNESEAKYRDLVETSQGLIWRANLEGRFTYLNPACEETFGYPIEEMLGQLFTALEDPEMSAKNIEMFSSVLAGNTITGAETKFLTKSGESIALLINAKPLYDTDGNVIGTQGTAHDITERKKSELLALDNQHLRTQFQKEQEQTTVIQNIISTLSHDMKTPLAVISLSRDILANYYDKLSEEKRQEKLDTIDHQLQFAIQLLNDTVQVARGAHVFQPSLVNLATLCEISIHEWYMGQTDNHDLIFINIGQIENVIIDETLVSRILLNLLSNAVKYSPDGGEIRLELDYYDDGIELRLTDHGIGISEEDLPNIFDLLYRAKNVKNILGTGLGLNIAKDCVDRHNGIITVQSEVGKGSIFTVKIPTASDADTTT